MIRNSRRAVVLAVAGAVAIAPVLTGCGAGGDPQTAAPTQLTEGVNVTVPKDRPEAAQVDVRNMFLLGPKPDTAFGQGSSLPLYATVINQVKGRPDKLVGVTSPNFAQARITGGAVVLPPAQPSGQGSAVQLVGNAEATPAPSATASEKPGKKKKDKKPDEATPGTSATPSGGTSATPSGGTSATPSGGTSATPSGGASATPSGAVTPEPTGAGATPDTTSTPDSSNTPSAPPGQPSVPVAPPGKAPLVVLTGLNRQVFGGERLTLRLQFEQAGAVDVSVPVVPQQGEYASYTAVSAGTPVPGAAGGEGHPAGTATPGTPSSAPAEPNPTGTSSEGATPTATPTEGGH